ncbi:MAG: DEAD/DEAH box helicase, partial [Bacillales bacterium]|nr:DEAD/DEAH box helicase [Bacillales bacterium]
MTTFKNYIFKEYIEKTLKDINFITPTEVQERVVPFVLKKRNVIVKAPTGTGKTHAYLLGLLQNINEDEKRTQVLILTPTRELALQTFQIINEFVKNEERLKIKLCIGGKDSEVIKEVPQIVIGTPSRILKLIMNKSKLNLSKLSSIVIDEADMLMESGFVSEIEAILETFKVNQTILLSATINQELRKVLVKYLFNPEYVEIGKSANPFKIKHIIVPLKHLDRTDVTISILKNINPFLTIVFVSKIENIQKVFEKISNEGFKVGILHGKLTQQERTSILKRIQSGVFQVIVASDIASRGIDLTVSEVINYDLPYNSEYFFHRSGRTARNEAEGKVYSIADEDNLKKLQTLIDIKQATFMRFKDGAVILKNPYVVIKKKFKSEEVEKILKYHKGDKIKPNYKKKVKLLVEKQKQK